MNAEQIKTMADMFMKLMEEGGSLDLKVTVPKIETQLKEARIEGIKKAIEIVTNEKFETTDDTFETANNMCCERIVEVLEKEVRI